MPIDSTLSGKITVALEEVKQQPNFALKESVERLSNAVDYCNHCAELEQSSEQYQAQQPNQEDISPQSQAFMEMM